MNSKKIELVLKPSTLGQYFENKCNRYLLCKSIDGETLNELGWSVPGRQPLTASAQAGAHWEAILLNRLLKDKNCIVKNLEETVGKGKAVTLEDTVKALKSFKSTKKIYYIYHANISTPKFNAKYLSNKSKCPVKAVMSKQIQPDFIKAEFDENEGKYKLTIVDAKNAGQLKRGAVVQVAVYAQVLNQVIEDKKNGISNCFVNKEEGIIWNREKVSDERVDRVFSLKSASNELKEFFNTTVPKLCKALSNCNNGDDLANNVDIRVSQMCEYCNRFDDCKARCVSQKSFHLLPYLPVEAQDRVYELIKNGNVEINTTLESVMNLLQTQPELLTEGCSYWNIVRLNRDAYSDAMNTLFDPQQNSKDRYPKPNSASDSLPSAQNLSLFLTAQQDVDSGRMYAYSWLLKPGQGIAFRRSRLNRYGYVEIKDNFDTATGYKKYYNTYIAEKRPWKKDKNGKEVIDRKVFDQIDRKFVNDVYGVLKNISRLPDASKKLQIYVMDRYEYINIENALYNMLGYLDPETDEGLEQINKVIAILFCIQGSRIATDAKSVPEKVLDNPVCVLTSEISKLYALPVGVAYNLRDIAPLFKYSKMAYNFDAGQRGFFEPLANVIDGRKILDIWDPDKKADKAANIKKLKKHITRRLFVEMQILLAIQNDCRVDDSVVLCNCPSSYEHYDLDYPDSPEAARLVYENYYEELLDYKTFRSRRLLGPDDALEKGVILSLEYTGEGKVFRVLNPENIRAGNWFTPWFCKDTPENRRNIMKFCERMISGDDTQYTIAGTGSTYYSCKFNLDLDLNEDGDDATIKVSPILDANCSLDEGRRYLLFEIYADYNSYKTNKALELLDERQELINPKDLSGNTGISYDEQRPYFESYNFTDGHWFSDSQKNAFRHLVENRLTVLVGPPATGKTDFIARSIISLARYYKDVCHRNLKIMVTAMSHSAIDNVLLKLHKLSCYTDINLYKAERFDDDKVFSGTSVKRLKIKNSKKNRDRLFANVIKEDQIQIFGMTCWAAYNAFFRDSESADDEEDEVQSPLAFDLIVMDEASQVRTMDSFLNLECSDENTRFLIVGDDDQLPAIFKGKYKQTEGEKYIFGSVFRMLLTGLREGLDYPNEDHPDIVQLSENFRMNSILCKYAKNIYDDSYRSYNDTVGNRKISLRNTPNDPFSKFVLDPEYPLVFCELFGDASSQTEKEIELVTGLISDLWNELENNEDGSLARVTGSFWQPNTDNGISYEGACGIISPHHEHIRKLRDSIVGIPLHYQNRNLNKKDIYIGTVDKLQGKERLAVIVSYGMADKEKIRHEAEFIFSRNRFNVSLTRGKGKTIVFLSDALAEPDLNSEVLAKNDKELEKGISYIHGFSRYMKEDREDEAKESFPFTFGNVKVIVWKKKQI